MSTTTVSAMAAMSAGAPLSKINIELAPLQADEAKDRAVFIRDSIKIVENLRDEGKSFDEMKEAVPEFANNFPHLFIMVSTKEGYSEETLKTMLAMLDRMAVSKVSQHEASIHVGTHLKNKFVSK